MDESRQDEPQPGGWRQEDMGRAESGRTEEERDAYRKIHPRLGPNPILYEDADFLFVRKPPGILSQKASPADISMNEWLRGYLASCAGPGAPCRPYAFRPAVCNRLDRNTGGILLCAKSLRGSRVLSALLRERRIRKTYRMIVHGAVESPGRIRGDLQKDQRANLVRLQPPLGLQRESRAEAGAGSGKSRFSETRYRPCRTGLRTSLVEADLVTGRSHQLRVHMASLGHPILFDAKYGDPASDQAVLRQISGLSAQHKRRTRAGQLLWCAEVAFPALPGQAGGEAQAQDADLLARLSGRAFCCHPPAWWNDFLY